MEKSVKQTRISEYSYELPDERIARYPLPERDSSKLLVYRRGNISEDVFRNLPCYLPAGAMMVFNNTKVIQARLHFHKEATGGPKSTGALIEVFLLEPAEPSDYQVVFTQTSSCSWYCLVGNLKRWKEDTPVLSRTVQVGDKTVTLTAKRGSVHGTSHRIVFNWDGGVSWAELLEAVGEIPIPPYLNRESQESDKTTYQTVYSKIKGSVAAPTAGLHFTERVLRDLDAHGIDREELTLHKAAKQAFDELGVKKLPKVKELNAEYAELFAGKKAAYAEYRKLRDEAQELLIAQSNIGSIYDFAGGKLLRQEKEEQKR